MIKHYCNKCGKELWATIYRYSFAAVYDGKMCNVLFEHDTITNVKKYGDIEIELCRKCSNELKEVIRPYCSIQRKIEWDADEDV